MCDCLSTVARPRQYRRPIEHIRPLRHFNLYVLNCNHLTCLHRLDGVAIYAACASAVGVVPVHLLSGPCSHVEVDHSGDHNVIEIATTEHRSPVHTSVCISPQVPSPSALNRAASCTTPQDDAPTRWGRLFSAEPCRRGGVRQVGRARAGHDTHARHRRATKPSRRHQRTCWPSGVGVWWCARHQRNMRARSGGHDV